MSRSKSSAAFARAKALIPGGVNSPARAFGGVGGEPIFFDHGEGAYLVDIDGTAAMIISASSLSLSVGAP